AAPSCPSQSTGTPPSRSPLRPAPPGPPAVTHSSSRRRRLSRDDSPSRGGPQGPVPAQPGSGQRPGARRATTGPRPPATAAAPLNTATPGQATAAEKRPQEEQPSRDTKTGAVPPRRWPQACPARCHAAWQPAARHCSSRRHLLPGLPVSPEAGPAPGPRRSRSLWPAPEIQNSLASPGDPEASGRPQEIQKPLSDPRRSRASGRPRRSRSLCPAPGDPEASGRPRRSRILWPAPEIQKPLAGPGDPEASGRPQEIQSLWPAQEIQKPSAAGTRLLDTPGRH
ncbi:PREDICTED: vegetative cell wall protein gp1-like, partial [Condylura cristata]|uniref:vegetative cell wall protein gp1-like n=1 Tax=Condylura cristata TaxID=143302 RepID=UPI0006433542